MVYDYQCDCGKTKEVDHGMNEKPEITCECGKIMRKAVSKPNFILAGEGWAKDGYCKRIKD
jgi:putative FmdB family regulatory protein